MNIEEQWGEREAQYEYIPKYDELLPPATDRQSYHSSKPMKHGQQNTSQYNIQNEEAELLRHKVEVLKAQLSAEREKNEQIETVNSLYENVYGKIVDLIRKQGSFDQEYSINVTSLVLELEELLRKHSHSNYEAVIQQQGKQIAQLRADLFSSTQNNINAIFNTQITSQQCLEKEFSEMKKQINTLKEAYLAKQNSMKEETLLRLVTNYEELLRQYRNKEQILKTLQDGQNNTNLHFQELRQQLIQTIELTCLSKHGSHLQQLESRLTNALDSLHTPECLKPECEEELGEKEILVEISNLHQTISSQQVQIDKLKAYNIRLEGEIHDIRVSSIENHRVSVLEEKCKQKDRRIFELENTIIDHLGEKAKESGSGLRISEIESSNSGGDKEQKLRNYKTIIRSLKQEMKDLKNQLRVITSASTDNYTSLERVSQDEFVLTLMQEILQIFIAVKKNHGQCNCLEQLIDTLLQNKQTYPEFEELLINYGFIETSSNLISLHYNELTNI